MGNFGQKADNFVMGVLYIGCTPCFIILIAVIGIFRSCLGYDEIDIDNSIMTRRYPYARTYITDSTGVGFECLWYTTKSVTDKREREIKSRQHLIDSYKRFKAEAAEHFNHDFINTDIYDFVKYAKTFDLDSADVRLVNIWVYGSKYEDLYRRPHPDYPDGVHILDDNHELGELYLEEYDVYPYNFEAPRKYRYWGCYATSLTDERHTHITDDDRRKTRSSWYDDYFREKEKQRNK